MSVAWCGTRLGAGEGGDADDDATEQVRDAKAERVRNEPTSDRTDREQAPASAVAGAGGSPRSWKIHLFVRHFFGVGRLDRAVADKIDA
ncbi:MAG TPA: hypothetical protein VN969_10545 [Streptosporangiaceae bacterium]|nr:hypothetical protein [Streptosporangiaceae bacterium]